jgi:DNA mismatch repair protein MutS2
VSVLQDKLECAPLIRFLEAQALTPLGAAYASRISPLRGREAALARISSIEEVRMLVESGYEPPIAGARSIDAFVELAEKGIALEGPKLRAVAATARAGHQLLAFARNHSEIAPVLYALTAPAPDLGFVADEIERVLDEEGLLYDEATPLLRDLRRRVRRIREEIHTLLEAMLRDGTMQHYLQEDYFTIRQDRYVLPIQASFQNQVSGIVHDTSGTGQTVFIEPTKVVEAGNRLKIAQGALEDEEQRILAELTLRVVEEVEALRTTVNLVAEVDFFVAASRMAKVLGCVPVLPSDEAVLDLRAARHPALVLQRYEATKDHPLDEEARVLPAVVANHLALLTDQRVLVITGPNTGGKTVALKTVGLLAWMVRVGLPIPCASGSAIGWFDPIEVVVGDDQSMGANVSTFQAHVGHLRRVLQTAQPGVLILVDEIAADTDPVQGQALAQAVLERLADRGAHVVVTTHFERLKAIPFVDKRFRNAGVGFDPERLRPTYHLVLDVPQSSSGLDIAEALGLSPELVARARALLAPSDGGLDEMMRSFQTETSRAMEARQRAEEAAERAEAEADKLAQERLRITTAAEEARIAAREGLLREIELAQAEVRRIVSTLQSARGVEEARAAMRQATEAQRGLAEMEQTQEARLEADLGATGSDRPSLDALVPGDWVHVRSLGRDGEVVSMEDRIVHVSVGKMRMRVAKRDLTQPKAPRPKSDRRRSSTTGALAQAARAETTAAELDVRGLTVDESLERLEAFLDVHYGSGRQVTVVHGHGTGVVRRAVRIYLKDSGYVSDHRAGGPTEGGDGVTVVRVV